MFKTLPVYLSLIYNRDCTPV